MQERYFEKFRTLMPATRVLVWEHEMIYYFTNPSTAKYFESLALQIILENSLPLVVESETWAKRGFVFERNMKITLAPEETLITA